MEADGRKPSLEVTRVKALIQKEPGNNLVAPHLQKPSQGSQRSPSPKTVQANHTPPMSASPSSHRSTGTKSRHISDSQEAVVKVAQDSSIVADKEGKQGRLQRMTWRGKGDTGKERAVANNKQYTKMGLVMESPDDSPQQLPWAMGSLKLVGTGGSGRSRGSGQVVGQGTASTGGMLRSSPPIAVEGMENGRRSPREGRADQGDVEGVFSSPDSGYGNTPDQQATAATDQGRMQPQAVLLPKRARSGAIMGPTYSEDTTGDASCRVSSQNEGLRGDEMASGEPLSTSDLLFRRDSQHRGRRQREDTQDSALFMDSSASHDVSSRDLQQQLGDDSNFPFTGGFDSGSADHRLVKGRGVLRQAHTVGGRLNKYSMPSQLSGDSRTAMSGQFSSRAGSASGVGSASLSFNQSKKKHKSLYQRSFTKSSSDYRSKSLTVGVAGGWSESAPQEEKDYFRVTDELAQENAHHTMSEKMVEVLERYRASVLEKAKLKAYMPKSLQPPSSSLALSSVAMDASNMRPSSPTSVSGALRSPVGGSTPCHSPSSNLRLPLTSVNSSSPPNVERFPSLQTPVDLSSWSSMSSIATTEDSYDGAASISLLSLIEARPTDRSAESIAQKLLQQMAQNLTGGVVAMSELAVRLPTDFVDCLQMDEDLRKSVTTSAAHTRGSREWAPPRKTIVYHIKLQPKNAIQDEVASKQGGRCTGCGMKVDASVARNFRFCNYTGKFFCQSCHINSTHVIPAHILEHWSFRKMTVSNFARDMLSKMQNEAVFSVSTSHSIYKKAGSMAQVREVRGQLVSLRQYLRLCRGADNVNKMFEEAEPWTANMELYSLNDFTEVRSGAKLRQLRSLVAEGVAHVKTCPVCQGKGFVCEFCHNSDDVIFPFEIAKVSRCNDCQCCFHKRCFRDTSVCPRCARMKERQRRRVQTIVMEEEGSEAR